jgi:hypothetical protein
VTLDPVQYRPEVGTSGSCWRILLDPESAAGLVTTRAWVTKAWTVAGRELAVFSCPWASYDQAAANPQVPWRVSDIRVLQSRHATSLAAGSGGPWCVRLDTTRSISTWRSAWAEALRQSTLWTMARASCRSAARSRVCGEAGAAGKSAVLSAPVILLGLVDGCPSGSVLWVGGRVLIEQGRRGTAERQGSLLGRCRGWAEGARGFDLEGAYLATIVMRLARRTKCSSYLGGVSTSVMGLSSSL